MIKFNGTSHLLVQAFLESKQNQEFEIMDTNFSEGIYIWTEFNFVPINRAAKLVAGWLKELSELGVQVDAEFFQCTDENQEPIADAWRVIFTDVK